MFQTTLQTFLVRKAVGKVGGPKIKKSAMSVGTSSSNPNRKLTNAKVNGGTARTKAKINILKMYKNAPIRTVSFFGANGFRWAF